MKSMRSSTLARAQPDCSPPRCPSPPRLLFCQDLLRLVPPLLLRALFEDLRPDASALQYEAMAAAGAGAPAARLAAAADAALGVKAAVQVGEGERMYVGGGHPASSSAAPSKFALPWRAPTLLHPCSIRSRPQADQPLWDARAAVLLLLMARCAADAAALRALGGTAFFSALLSEADARVRHYAAVFVLRQLMLTQPRQYRWAGTGRLLQYKGRAWYAMLLCTAACVDE